MSIKSAVKSFSVLLKFLKQFAMTPRGQMVLSAFYGMLSTLFAYDGGSWNGPLWAVLSATYLPPFPRLFALVRLARWEPPVLSTFAYVAVENQGNMILVLSGLILLMVWVSIQWFPSVIKRFLFGTGVGMVLATSLWGVNVMENYLNLATPLGEHFYTLTMLVLMAAVYFLGMIQKSRRYGSWGGKTSSGGKS